MDWGTLAATFGGAGIAIAGTVLADQLRGRREDGRELEARRRQVYIEFISAAGAAHTRLRELAQDAGTAGAAGIGRGPDELETATRAALTDADIYEVRERLYIDASARVAGAGQRMFERLRDLRRVVANGASLGSAAFHRAYHPYIASAWDYRVAVRQELEGRSLSPSDFGWSTWDGRERCPLCHASLEEV